MKINFALLAIANLLLLMITAWVGLAIGDRQGLSTFTRHFLLGVLCGVFTCFVHIVLFMYFVVQAKIIEQSVLHHNLSREYHKQVLQYKSRALLLSSVGILSVLVTIALGAAIGIAFRPKVHLAAAFISIAINAVVFYRQHALIVSYGEIFRAAFGQ